jgi:hypothetical protein
MTNTIYPEPKANRQDAKGAKVKAIGSNRCARPTLSFSWLLGALAVKGMLST